jgi:hypothetical protein
LIVCAAAAATTAAAAQASSIPPRAVLTNFACRQAAISLNRAISVTAVMRPISGTQRLALRFELQRRASAGKPFTDVTGSGLGKWLYPTNPPTLGQQPGDKWRYNKPVVNLATGTYRFRVSFRWIGSGGTALQTVVRLSPRCVQG